ncbi:MAG: O-methyltransferase [Acidobacteria bacterium]|nr:O-methyltransferase [Acidobacteriota bacterium]
MDLLAPGIEDYLRGLLPPADEVRGEMEDLGRRRGFPIVGPLVGHLVFCLARSIEARSVFELGSGFGYSAYWFARAVGPGGRVYLTDRSRENLDQAREFLTRAGLADRTLFLEGDALEILPGHPGPFDILFNDIDKEDYPEVLPTAAPRLRPGGLLICDNMLWFGRVLTPDPDPATRGVRELTRRLIASPDFHTILLPVRDGVSVSLKRGTTAGANAA